MSADRPVVRAIVRDLGRTGVPIALARMATWPGTADAIDLHVVARDDGPLGAELERQGIRVVVLEPGERRSIPSLIAAGAAHLRRPEPGAAVQGAAWRFRVRPLPRPDAVLVQGAGAWPIAMALGHHPGPRVAVHLHELAIGLRRSVDRAELAALAAVPVVLAVSGPVAALARRIGIPEDRIRIVPGTVAAEAPLPAGTDHLVSIGEAGWRKGTDRAIAAAYELGRRDPQRRWHWIGREPEPGWAYAAGTDVPVSFHAPVSDPWTLVPDLAALVVPSREDALPLVALEAGARGVPVVACRGSGGLDELLAEGRGWLVDAADPAELAIAAIEAATSDRSGRADALRDHILRCHSADAVAPRWLEAIVDAARS